VTWRTAGIYRILTEREDVTLVDGYRHLTSRIVLLCNQGVYTVDAVLWWVIHPTIIGLICPSEIYCVHIRRDGGFNLDPVSTTAPTTVRTMQDDVVVYNFY
jgi:hypothetical protein